jgi:ABC-type transport system substrate-binding protein
MPSLNVTHELYSGLTRFSGRGVKPDLAESWDVEQGGLVWTFHLRKDLRWSDGRKLTAGDLRRSWLRALAPATRAPLAGPDLGIVRGSRAFHASGRGRVGVEAPDDRTLRVSLQHPIPWLDELAAWPIAAAYRPGAYSGPFRLASRRALERNLDYWDARAVKPARIVFTTDTKGADAILPRGLAPPGLPWVQTAKPPTGPGWRKLPTLSLQLLWIRTRRVDSDLRTIFGGTLSKDGLIALVPPAMPGRAEVTRAVTQPQLNDTLTTPQTLTLAYSSHDALAPKLVRKLSRWLAAMNLTVAAHAGSARGADLVLLGWNPKIFDAYNIFDLFPCGSAFNVAQWCDPAYDGLMRRAVRTLDDRARRQVERRILRKLLQAVPVVPVGQPPEYVKLSPGVRGFSWSPIGLYELSGMTRS